MADINYFLELSPECVKFILNLLGYEEIGRAACVCREFYKELTPRAKTIAHTIRCVVWKSGANPTQKKKWGDLSGVTALDRRHNKITDLALYSSVSICRFNYF
eukprot:SAG22_NODE_1535_length_4200_cov_301.283346_4_plen_103_part_00